MRARPNQPLQPTAVALINGLQRPSSHQRPPLLLSVSLAEERRQHAKGRRVHHHRRPRPSLICTFAGLRSAPAWDPFVRDMRFGSGATGAGKGVRVWVRAWTGLTMEVEFTSFRPPSSVAMKMVRGPWFFRQFAGTWLFERRADGRTEVTFRYFFAARGRWLARFTEPIMAWIFRRDVRGRYMASSAEPRRAAC